MPEEINVTVTKKDDGTFDIASWTAEHPLSPIKQLIDGLNGNVTQLKAKTTDLAAYQNLGSIDEIKGFKDTASKAQAALDQAKDLEGKIMTDEQKSQFDELTKLKEQFGDITPEQAQAALKFQKETQQTKAVTEAFKAAGFDAEAALLLDGVKALETKLEPVKVKDAKGNETTENQALVKVGDAWQPLKGYVETNYSKALTLITPQQEQKPNPTQLKGPNPPVMGNLTPSQEAEQAAVNGDMAGWAAGMAQSMISKE